MRERWSDGEVGLGSQVGGLMVFGGREVREVEVDTMHFDIDAIQCSSTLQL